MFGGKLIKKYMGFSLSYGIARGFYYNYNRNDICNNDKYTTILATALINPAYIGYSIYHDYKNFRLYYNNKKIIEKDWWCG
jgi:hypothetical protein